MEEYLTVPQVAELLQLSEKTVYRLAQRGELPGFKAGGSWRFRRTDIDAWAAEQIRGKRHGEPG
jgi:excisionase family DNA binding protein